MHVKSSRGAQHTVSTQQILELITVLLSKVYVIPYEKKTKKTAKTEATSWTSRQYGFIRIWMINRR